MKILFATHNQHKAQEIEAQCGNAFQILTLRDLDITEEIAETAETLEGNARIKAKYLWDRFHEPCFADDTGLEVVALGGRPGVYSARYAGEDGNAEKNMAKLLEEMAGAEDRRAQFRTVIIYIDRNGEEHLFEGIVKGRIATEKSGSQGFGYDPIFIPDDGDGGSFAEMSLEEKNKISHRGRAVKKFIEYLRSE